MKSYILPISIVFAAVSAIFIIPVGAIAAGGCALMPIGVLAIFFADYRRILKPLNLPACILAFDPNERAPRDLDAAA